MLKGKNVIITGTTRGIGKALVEEFARNGANIWAHARKETPEYLDYIAELSKKYNVIISPVFFDMTDYDGMKAAIMKINNEKRPIDALINNAGIMNGALFTMTTQEMLRREFEVNFFSVFALTQYVVKLMLRKQHGSIVNISSYVAFEGTEGRSAYAASKAALIAMTKTISNEFGTKGIRANCIAPGVVNTNLLNNTSEEEINKAKDSAALRRIAEPIEIAKAAVYLASDNSSFVTGQTVRVDGGM